MIDARAVIAGFIGQHEGGVSTHPADNGNWYSAARYQAGQPQQRGTGRLVGSAFGVTAYALVRYRLSIGWPLARAIDVTDATMRALTLYEAVSIGLALYYVQPRLDQLAWNRVTASVLDKAWGSGPGRAIDLLQDLLGLAADGDIGPVTVDRYAAWLRQEGEETAAHLWCEKRIAFDQSLCVAPNDPDRAFIGGWNNRSRSFLPGTPWWRAAA